MTGEVITNRLTGRPLSEPRILLTNAGSHAVGGSLGPIDAVVPSKEPCSSQPQEHDVLRQEACWSYKCDALLPHRLNLSGRPFDCRQLVSLISTWVLFCRTLSLVHCTSITPKAGSFASAVGMLKIFPPSGQLKLPILRTLDTL